MTIEAPPAAVWRALADIGSIERWNPGVVRSRQTTAGEPGLGAGRRCELGGRDYLEETVVEWAPGTALTLRIVATNLPFAAADIRFTLTARGPATQVTVAPEYRLKFGLLGDLLDALFVRSRYRKGMIELLYGLKRHIEARDTAPRALDRGEPGPGPRPAA